MKFTYIEIKRYDDDTAVARVDVSNSSERSVEQVERGMNINLNHSEYFTSVVNSEIELELF